MVSLEHYPQLGPMVALRGHQTAVPSSRDYMISRGQFAETLSANFYELLRSCDGQSSLAAILNNYDEASQEAVFQALTETTVSRNVLRWLERPATQGLGPYQAPDPSHQPLPLNQLVLHLLNECNFRCDHCYHNDYRPTQNLSLSELDDLAEQFFALNGSSVTLTGGEPFLRRDLLDIVHQFTRRLIGVSINTNASLITEEHVQEMRCLHRTSPLGGLSISLDGLTEHTHNLIRHNSDSWHHVFRVLSLCEEYGVPVRLSSLVTRHWLADVEHLDEFLERLNGHVIFQWSLYAASPAGEAARPGFDDTLQLTPEETVHLGRTIKDTLQRLQPPDLISANILKFFKWTENSVLTPHTTVPLGEYFLETGTLDHVLCEEHKDILFMEPDGSVPFCTLFKSRFPMEIGQLRATPLSTLWERLAQLRVDHPTRRRAHCGTCQLLPYCGGGCPGEDPTPNANLLTSCDTNSRAVLPLLLEDLNITFNEQKAATAVH
jgi:radical SAM protein with 4Fe4S-binding SPASM domain